MGAGCRRSRGSLRQAMTALAERQRRRRRIVGAAVVAALAIGLGVVGAFWARSEAARRQTAAEALRAEAGKLLALGQAELERDPTAALAYATKSLELADTEEARRLGLRVLQGGPTQLTALTVPGSTALGATVRPLAVAFSPNGEWFAVTGAQGTRLFRRDGGPIATIEEAPTDSVGSYAFDSTSRLLIGNRSTHVGVWSVPDGREIRRLEVEPGFTFLFLFVRGRGFFSSATVGDREVVRWAALTDADSRLVGTMDAAVLKDVDAAGAWMAYVPGGYMSGNRRLHLRSLQNWALTPRLIATHPADIAHVAFHPDGRHVAAGDAAGKIRIWATNGGSGRPLRVLDCPGGLQLTYSPRREMAGRHPGGRLQPLRAALGPHGPTLGRTLAGSHRRLPVGRVGLRPVRAVARDPVQPRSRLVASRRNLPALRGEARLAGGQRRLHSRRVDARVCRGRRHGPCAVRLARRPRRRADPPAGLAQLSRVGRRPGRKAGRRLVVGQSPRPASRGRRSSRAHGSVQRSPYGHRGLLPGWASSRRGGGPGAAGGQGRPDLGPRERRSRVLGPLPGAGVGDAAFATDLAFADDDHVVTGSLTSGLLLFDLHDGTHTVLSSRPTLALAVDRGRRVVLALAGESEPKELVRLGLDGQAPATVFPCPGCHSVALDPTGMVVAAGSADGIVRIGPASGGEPHLFFGHPSAGLQKVAFSPDGRWVASSGEQPGVRLWPVPDVTRTPLHRRSHEEVLATLRSWTNLRAVKDPQSPTGWKLEPGPFPGWARLPEW